MEQTTGPVVNGIKAAGEIFVAPGASLALDGDIKDAAFHFGGAVVARLLLGPVGWFLVAADSYSRSTSGKSLIQQVTSRA